VWPVFPFSGKVTLLAYCCSIEIFVPGGAVLADVPP